MDMLTTDISSLGYKAVKEKVDKIDNDRYDIKVNEIITDNQKKVL